MYTPIQLVKRVSTVNAWLTRQKDLHRAEHAYVGEQAAVVRKAMGLSLREVADEMGLSAPFIRDLERGHRLWTLETIQSWANAIAKLAA